MDKGTWIKLVNTDAASMGLVRVVLDPRVGEGVNLAVIPLYSLWNFSVFIGQPKGASRRASPTSSLLKPRPYLTTDE